MVVSACSSCVLKETVLKFCSVAGFAFAVATAQVSLQLFSSLRRGTEQEFSELRYQGMEMTHFGVSNRF